LYLVRHAHAPWRPGEDRPLSDEGLAQARRVAAILGPIRPAAVYSSPALRAVQTVRPLAIECGLEILVEPDLRERELGCPECGFEEAVRATWADPDFAHPEGESNVAATARALRVTDRIATVHRGETVVVSTHGNLLALTLAAIDPSAGFAFWQELGFPDVYRVDGTERSGRPRIARVWSDPA